MRTSETASLLPDRRGGSGLNTYSSPYKKPPWFRRTKFYTSLFQRGFAEFLATGLFVFVAVSASSSVNTKDDSKVTSSAATVVGLATGLVYAALMAANMHVSGGHMNPAITLGVFVAGGINVVAAVVYIGVQLLGGIVGAACVLAYDNDNTNYSSVVDYGLTTLHGEIYPLQGIAVEAVLTLLLVMVYIHTTMEGVQCDLQGVKPGSQLPPASNPIAPLAVGFALAAGIMSSYSITGGSFNPARSLGPAVVATSSWRWTYHYVYWAGPIIGAVLAGAFHRLVLSSQPLIPLTDSNTKRSGIINSNSLGH